MNLLQLHDDQAPEPARERQLPLFERSAPAAAEFVPHLLPAIEEARARVVGRRTFLVSLLLHVAVISFLASHPDLIHLGAPEVRLPREEPREVTMLYQPPPPLVQPRLQAPPAPPPRPAPALPRAQGTLDSPLETPRPLPGKGLAEPAQPKPQPLTESEGDAEQEPQQPAGAEARGLRDVPEESPPASGREPSRTPLPKLEEPPPTEARLRLPVLPPPGRGTDAILREMARQQAEGGGGQRGLSSFVPNPGDPNFNLPGPQILSDTMGVNFDPYLLRVYLSVQRNWYSVIPEIARLGRKGRVILQFRILKNGAVQDLQMMDGSGTASMDQAALSSIRLSNPFPPLPPEFPGDEIVLRFGYYYNMRPEYDSGR
ncbi:MAG TPA: TonB family protein [Terriglobia bacterium]|nr:TonB family protein [Terriglobia bacterium]